MRSHSLKQEVEKEEVELGTRRSNRNLQKIDYKAMHSGRNQMITTGDTIMSEHMALRRGSRSWSHFMTKNGII